MPKKITLEEDAEKKQARKNIYFSDEGFLYQIIALPERETLTGKEKTLVAYVFFHNQGSHPFFKMERDYFLHCNDRRATSEETERFHEAKKSYDKSQERQRKVTLKRNMRRKNSGDLEKAV